MPKLAIIGVENARLQFTIPVSDDEDMPDVIKLQDGRLLVLVGKYASPGSRYSYRLANRVITPTCEPREWVEHTHLEG